MSEKATATQAVWRKRHGALVGSALILVVLPVALVAGYLWVIATPQFASTAGFTVRQEEGASAGDFAGGLAKFVGGGSAGGDADILYEFIQSQQIVKRVDERLDLKRMFASTGRFDPLYSLSTDATIEEMLSYWRRAVRISYDQNTGLIELLTLAFTPEDAKRLSQTVIEEGELMINELNQAAREDFTKFAEIELRASEDRLRTARRDLMEYRSRTHIVDPLIDLQGRMGVLSGLQAQLTDAIIEYDLLLGTAAESDPRLKQAKGRIDVIRDRIVLEREDLVKGRSNGQLENYPVLISEFEELAINQRFAEQSYTAALSALDVSRSEANRQTRYLATYVKPTIAQSAEYPKKLSILGLTALFMTLIWAIAALVYYSLRDRR